MTFSCDTNILFPACNSTSPRHQAARRFLEKYSRRDDFCLCEQVLMELYCLLRNPAVCRIPLSSSEATDIIQSFRSNPHWPVVDVATGSNIMDEIWQYTSRPDFAYRDIFDARLAVTLQHHGVTQFATCNEKDFLDFGFQNVWNPLSE